MTAPDATETAVIVPVPAAEPVVAHHRRQFDQAASWGVGAHVTVLYPFVPPALVDDELIARLGQALAGTREFDCIMDRCEWFGTEVVYLEPAPDEPFRHLTSSVWRAFPDYPPYGGVHDTVIPHLTIGETRFGTLEQLKAAEADVTQHLPVKARIDTVRLIAGTAAPDSWHTLHEYRLADCARKQSRYVLIVISGLPGTGKSAVAAAVATELGAVHLSIDPIEDALLGAGLPRSWETGVAAYEAARAAAEQNLALGRTVVVDAVNDSQEARDTWRRGSARAGAELVFVMLTLNDETEHRRRLEKRARSLTHIPAPTWNEVQQRAATYAPWAEDCLHVSAEQPVDQMAREILSRLPNR